METSTGVQKVAKLLVLLGEETTAKVFKMLAYDEVQEITREISLADSIDKDEAEALLEEVYNMYMAQEYIAQGGIEYAKKVLSKSMPPDEARRIIDRLTKTLQTTGRFTSLRNVDPSQLSKIIENEHPQTIALVIGHLDPSRAAELLSALPEEIRSDVTLRLAALEEISPEVLTKIGSVLDEKLESLSGLQTEEVGGVRMVAEILNRMDRSTSRGVLEMIESNNPELAATIRDLMFVFDDILLLDDMSIREILKNVDRKALTMALKGTTDEMKEKFMRNMSERAQQLLVEEMDYLGPVRLKDVEAAQREIVEVVRGLEEEQVIQIGGGGDEVVV
ncbi:MAG: flagellar motor switch protein FliG [Candidatus Coatesbacteria bacterium]|nr:MAG: flagellar motor switch protein FliG [Candidatus Coatesbacteria bacterium]